MTTLSIRLPDSLHQQVKILSKQDGISLNAFIASAVAEKMSALMTEQYLQQRQALGSADRFLQVMAKVADVAPSDEDKIE